MAIDCIKNNRWLRCSQLPLRSRSSSGTKQEAKMSRDLVFLYKIPSKESWNLLTIMIMNLLTFICTCLYSNCIYLHFILYLHTYSQHLSTIRLHVYCIRLRFYCICLHLYCICLHLYYICLHLYHICLHLYYICLHFCSIFLHLHCICLDFRFV